ncbi:efflux RND transporter periplasmic adaptor subunit [Glaciecola siphonariae]|uniref:Efflux RND transporter periplasmic adaptor subunit n=1 Tax=Glaciecola siphonariae TaxID=521012 RepID=A0ABV9LTZ5_9ALTE
MFTLTRNFALFTAVFLLASCSQNEAQNANQQQAPEVDVALPLSATVTSWDEYSGRFEAINEVEIRARVSGYVESVNFVDGQQVNQGDVLFVIDQRPFQIALKSAEATYDLAKKELDRGLELRQRNSISQEEVDRRKNELDQAEAALAAARLDMEFTEVKTPITGLVSRDYVNEGNLISAANATLLTTVVTIDPIHFYFEAGESDFLQYARASQTGARESSRTAPNPVRVKLQDEDDFIHEGVMDFVDNRLDRSTGTIQGRAILENDNGLLIPGIFGRIQLLSREKDEVMLLPDAALNSDQNRRFVYIADENDTITRKYVELGKLHTPELRIIKAGLNGDERVVVNGLMRVRDGAKVAANEINLSAQYSL